MSTATQFTPVASLFGGALIGLSAVLLLWLNGRIAGVSGIAVHARRDQAFGVALGDPDADDGHDRRARPFSRPALLARRLGMHEAMRAAASLHRAELFDRRQWVSARDALRMATSGGARAMRLGNKVGAVVPGQAADLVLYRLDSPGWTPLNDPVAQLVFAESGAGVDCVMVAGRILLEGGRVTAFDAPAVLAEINSMVASLRQRNGDIFRVAAAIAERVPQVKGRLSVIAPQRPDASFLVGRYGKVSNHIA